MSKTGEFNIIVNDEIKDSGIEVIGGEHGIHLSFIDNGLVEYQINLGFDGKLVIHKHSPRICLMDTTLWLLEEGGEQCHT